MTEPSKLDDYILDKQSKDLTKLHPRLMKDGVFGYEIGYNEYPELKQHIKELFLELIGEDEQTKYFGDPHRIAQARKNGNRNSLRAELRKAVADL